MKFDFGKLLRWPHLSRLTILVPATTLLMMAAITSSLVRLQSVDFALSVRTDAISFDSKRAVSLREIPAGRIDVSGIDPSQTRGFAPSEDTTTGLGLVNTHDVMTLAAVTIPSHWTITIRVDDDQYVRIRAVPGPHSASSERATVSVLTLPGTVVEERAGDGFRTQQILKGDGSVELQMASLDLSFKPAKAKSVDLLTDFSPGTLSVQRVEEVGDERPGSTRFSVRGSIESGSLWIEHAARQYDKLGGLDRLTAEKVAQGFGAVSYSEGLLTLAVRGSAHELWNSPGDNRISLKPTVLDYLVDNGALKICLAILSFFAGLQLTAFIRSRK